MLLDDDDPPRRDDLLEVLFAFALDQKRADENLAMVGVVGAPFDARRGRIRRLYDDELRGVVSVDYVGGSQLPLVSVSALNEVGVFREDLFFGFDDLEFGLRLRGANKSVLVNGELAFWARESAGRLGRNVGCTRLTRAVASWRRYYSIRNLIFILLIHKDWAAALRVSIIDGFGKSLVLFLRSPRAGHRHLALGVRAVFDGWTGRLGRRVEPEAKGRPRSV